MKVNILNPKPAIPKYMMDLIPGVYLANIAFPTGTECLIIVSPIAVAAVDIHNQDSLRGWQKETGDCNNTQLYNVRPISITAIEANLK